MGFGTYSHDAHRALLEGRLTMPAQNVFTQAQCHPLMNPKGVRIRESRDSPDHPNSLGIAFALDVTGSMGDIPRLLASRELPSFMKVLMECQVPDPQLLFVAVGDAISDNAPLQVGQFESTAKLMDQWLTWSYLEGGGGGSSEESYELALYFLAVHTAMDCWEKRRKKGYLFVTGDEQPYPALSRHVVEGVIGDKLDEDLKVGEVVAELQKTFVPFFLIPDAPRRHSNGCEPAWREILGDNVLCMDDPIDTCYVASGAILLSEGIARDVDHLTEILASAGMDAARRGPVAKTLAPFANALHGLPGR